MRQANFPGHQSERRTCVSFPPPRFIAVCLIFAILPAISAAQDGPLTGIWRHAANKAELDQRYAAIDQATLGMGAFMRGRAREQLRNATKPPQELTLTEENDQLSFSINGRRLTMTIDGSPTRVSSEQGAGTTQVKRQDGKLVMIAEAESGKRTTVFLLSDDGQRLILDVSMASQKLGKPIRYRDTYVRR